MSEKRMGSRLGRIAALGSVGGVAFVSALMLLAPVSSATVITKPFKGLSSSMSYGASFGGCGKVKVLKQPTWAAKTGTFRTAGKGSAPACGQNKQNYGDWYSSFSLYDSKLKFTTSGNHTILISFKIAYATTLNITPWHGCVLVYTVPYSNCYSDASTSLDTFVFISDNSNSSWGTYGYGYSYASSYMSWYNYTDNYSDNYCYGGSCYHYGGNFSGGNAAPGSWGGVLYLNTTVNLSGTSVINKNDNFTMSIDLSASAYAAAYSQNAKGIGKASAFALMDIGSVGHGAILQGIVIT